jgi:hypothetical protein
MLINQYINRAPNLLLERIRDRERMSRVGNMAGKMNTHNIK